MKKQEYLDVIAEPMALCTKKSKDYQGAETSIGLHDYFPFADASYVQMLWVKVLRLVSLTSQTGEPNFESTKDSVVDLINYAVFYLQYLQSLEQDDAGA